MNKQGLADNIHNMIPEEIDNLMVRLGHDFDVFAEKLSKGAILEFAPPFNDYSTFDGDIISYYRQFFVKYKAALIQIPEETRAFVNLAMKAFIKHHTGKEVDCNLLNECESLMTDILKAVEKYFLGYPSEAFHILENRMLENDGHLLNILPKISFRGYDLYRVRHGQYETRPDLFHTPFNMRQKCGSYRFSIIGYPSLYLTGSVETALRETRIQDIEYSLSRFAVDASLYFADLTLPNKKLDFWERYAFVLFYPMIFACGLKVKDEKSPFKPEYVIPQILFQIIRKDSDMAGVSYTSTRYDNPDFAEWKQRNIVMKVLDTNLEEGYSERTMDLLTSTEPISPISDEALNDLEVRSKAMPLGRIK